MYAIRIHINK